MYSANCCTYPSLCHRMGSLLWWWRPHMVIPAWWGDSSRQVPQSTPPTRWDTLNHLWGYCTLDTPLVLSMHTFLHIVLHIDIDRCMEVEYLYYMDDSFDLVSMVMPHMYNPNCALICKPANTKVWTTSYLGTYGTHISYSMATRAGCQNWHCCDIKPKGFTSLPQKLSKANMSPYFSWISTILWFSLAA